MGACATKPKNVDIEKKQEKNPSKKSGELTRESSDESYHPRPTLREIFQDYDEKKDDKDDNNSVQENFHDAEDLEEEKDEPKPNDETAQKKQNLKSVPAEESKHDSTEESKPVSAEGSKSEPENKDESGELEKYFSFANLTEEKKKYVESESSANGVVTGKDGKEKEASPVGVKSA